LTPSQQLECHPSQLLLSRSRNRQHLGNKLRRNSTCVTACGLRLAFASRFMLQDAAGISKVHLLGANRVANFDALSCVDIPNTSFRLSRRPSESGHCLKVLPRSRKRGSQRMDKKHRISHDSCRIVQTRRCLKQIQQGQIDYVSKCINIVCT